MGSLLKVRASCPYRWLALFYISFVEGSTALMSCSEPFSNSLKSPSTCQQAANLAVTCTYTFAHLFQNNYCRPIQWKLHRKLYEATLIGPKIKSRESFKDTMNILIKYYEYIVSLIILYVTSVCFLMGGGGEHCRYLLRVLTC